MNDKIAEDQFSYCTNCRTKHLCVAKATSKLEWYYFCTTCEEKVVEDLDEIGIKKYWKNRNKLEKQLKKLGSSSKR